MFKFFKSKTPKAVLSEKAKERLKWAVENFELLERTNCLNMSDAELIGKLRIESSLIAIEELIKRYKLSLKHNASLKNQMSQINDK